LLRAALLGSHAFSNESTSIDPAVQRRVRGVAVEPLNAFGNLWDEEETEPGFAARRLRLGRRLGGELLGASVYELPPGERSFPAHFHHANEELLLVFAGHLTARIEGGEHSLRPGDALLFPRGPSGLHQFVNRSQEPVRFLVVSTMISPEVAEYPDSGKIGVFAQPPGSGRSDRLKRFLRSDATVEYLEGEPR
jgi:uncharacterized cupin superfamily protein